MAGGALLFQCPIVSNYHRSGRKDNNWLFNLFTDPTPFPQLATGHGSKADMEVVVANGHTNSGPSEKKNLLGLSFCVVQFNGGPAAIKIRIIITSRADQFHSKPSGKRGGGPQVLLYSYN